MDKILTFIPALIVALTGSVSVWLAYRKPKKKNEKLINHALFLELNKFLFVFKTKDICPNEPAKNEVLRLILVKKTEVGIARLTELANKIDSLCSQKCTNCPQRQLLKRINIDTLHQLLNEYTTFHKDGSYSESEQILIDYAMNKFNSIHTSAINLVEESIQMLDNDYSYSNCTATLQSMVFNMYLAAYTLTFRDANETIKKINGFFTDKEFRTREYKP